MDIIQTVCSGTPTPGRIDANERGLALPQLKFACTAKVI
jgi:hypothetical protein